MARSITLRKPDSILRELDDLRDAISRRAYQLFENRGDGGEPEADWLNAEQQIVWKPAIELRRKDSQFEVLAATPGVEAKDLDVRITPEEVLIKADVHHQHVPEKGRVQVCEFAGGQLFRSVHFPQKVDPDTATAEYHDGLLVVKAAVARPVEQRKVEVRSA